MIICRQLGRTTIWVYGTAHDASGKHLGLLVAAAGPKADIDALRMGVHLLMRRAGIRHLRLYEISTPEGSASD